MRHPWTAYYIGARLIYPLINKDLEIIIQDERNQISQSLTDNFIASMENKCGALSAIGEMVNTY